jgi:putative ABC transport system permease protein
VPAIDPLSYFAILGVTAAIAVLSMIIPTRRALRARPIDAIGARE